MTSDVMLRDVSETDLEIFFEQQRGRNESEDGADADSVQVQSP